MGDSPALVRAGERETQSPASTVHRRSLVYRMVKCAGAGGRTGGGASFYTLEARFRRRYKSSRAASTVRGKKNRGTRDAHALTDAWENIKKNKVNDLYAPAAN